MVKGAFLIVMVVSFSKVAIRESIESRKVFSRPETFRVTSLESGITKGRALRLCGAMGVKTMFFAAGSITGPPQLRE